MEIPESRRDWGVYADALPQYWNRDVVPSVSQLIAWAHGGPPEGVPAIDIALDRGKKVHHALHLKDEGTLDMASCKGHAELLGYMAQWAKFIERGDEFVCLETPLYGNISGVDFIVRPDRAIMRKGKLLVVDIKTKAPQARGPGKDEQLKHGLEVAAQKIAIAQRMGPLADWAGCMYLWPDHRALVGYNDARYMDQFGALVGRWADAMGRTQHAEVAADAG